MAQLHKQDGQGAATLDVFKTIGLGSSSPESEKGLKKIDNMRKR
jgi:hypothetical protein